MGSTSVASVAAYAVLLAASGVVCDSSLFVIAIGDDYRFAFFGLVTKL